jgi:hypothetical protein
MFILCKGGGSLGVCAHMHVRCCDCGSDRDGLGEHDGAVETPPDRDCAWWLRRMQSRAAAASVECTFLHAGQASADWLMQWVDHRLKSQLNVNSAH